MSALWLILAGVSGFMFFFTITEMSGVVVGFLSGGWFGAILLCVFEAIGTFRSSTRKPTRAERQEAYYQRMRQLSARRK